MKNDVAGSIMLGRVLLFALPLGCSTEPAHQYATAEQINAVPMPTIACGPTDAGADADAAPLSPTCKSPMARCVEATLVYFNHGKCVDGTCLYDRQSYGCPDGCGLWNCLNKNVTPPGYDPRWSDP